MWAARSLHALFIWLFGRLLTRDMRKQRTTQKDFMRIVGMLIYVRRSGRDCPEQQAKIEIAEMDNVFHDK
jgi:hypothetical protein